MSEQKAAEPVMLNPFEPGFDADPYAQYRKLREADPVHHTLLGPWALFRYEDVVGVLHDSDHSVEFEKADPDAFNLEAIGVGEPVVPPREQRSMLGLDPPDHTRLRRLVSKAFTPRTIREMEPLISRLVDDALDAADERGEMDVIADLAFPLPFTVISEMLGMPMESMEQIREWSGTLVRTLDPISTPETAQAAEEAAEKMDAYVEQVIADKRREPADDLLTALIAAEDSGDTLSTDELVSQIELLYIAGHETTVNLIGNGTLALLRDPDELTRLRDDPSLDANAVEELLRYDSPVQFSRRVLLKDVDVGERTLRAGEIALVALGAANRDPARFGPTAESLDLGREDAKQHTSFGGGVHFCLGAALARLEGRIAITKLVRRFAGIELTGDPVWNGRMNLRGLDSLPVTLHPARPS